MTKTIYIVTKYYFYESEWIIYISEDYEKADKCFDEHINKLRNQNGLQLREYDYDTDYDINESKKTIKNVIKEDGCLKTWTNEGWQTLKKVL